MVLFREAWTAYKTRWGKLVALSFSALIISFLLSVGLPLLAGVLIGVSMTSGGSISLMPIILVVILSVVFGIIIGFVSIWAQLALVVGVTDDNVTWTQAYRIAWSKFFSYLWVTILTGLLVVGAMMFFVIPGIIWGLSLVFVNFVFILENRRGIDAIARSRTLVRGRWWAVFGRVLLISLIPMVVSLVVSLLAKIFGELSPINYIATIIMWMIMILIVPFSLLYLRSLYLSAVSLTLADPQVKEPRRGWPIAFVIIPWVLLAISVVFSLLSLFPQV